MTCSMCGAQLRRQEAQRACEACPLSTGCQIICCPRCGYRMPAEPPLVDALRRWLQRVTARRAQRRLGRPKE